MATIFWDEDCVLIVVFLEFGRTINSERYVKVVRKLKTAIKKKHSGLNITNVTLHHDNSSACVQAAGDWFEG